MAIERHIYPGGNTPKGFFSYYSYILGQREANKIVCIKGGPGVGKSSFIRKIGMEWLYRLIKEPKRFKRQLDIPRFLMKIIFTKNAVEYIN